MYISNEKVLLLQSDELIIKSWKQDEIVAC